MPSGRSFVVPGPFGMRTRRSGRVRKVPDFSSRISASRFSSKFLANISTLTLSTPAAPRFCLTFRKACRINLGVILPVSEWALIFFMVGLLCSATTEFEQDGFGGRFLARSSSRPSRVSRQEPGWAHLAASAERLTFLMDRLVVFRLRWFPLSRRGPEGPRRYYSVSAATLKEEATKAAFSSPTASPDHFT